MCKVSSVHKTRKFTEVSFARQVQNIVCGVINVASFFMLIKFHPISTEKSVTTIHEDFPVFLHMDDLTFCAKTSGWEFFNHKHTGETFAVSKN